MVDSNVEKIPLIQNVQDKIHVEYREIEADRDKKLNSILKKVGDVRKFSPEDHCLTDRASLKELAKT